MFAKSILAYFCASVLLLANAMPVQAEAPNRLTGAWHTVATRNGSATRPVVFLFHGDGTMQYGSSTNIHTPATATPEVFFGRGGGFGTYRKVAGKPSTYKAYTEELLYDDVGNAKGRFLVEFTFNLPSKTDDSLSGEYKFRITSYAPGNLGLGDAITGEKEEIADNGQPGQVTGYRVAKSCYFTGGAKPCYEGPTDTTPSQ